MKFKPMSAAEYRALDADGLAQRRALLVDVLEGDEEVDLEQVRSEVAIVNDEYKRRNDAVNLRNLKIADIAGGSGTVVDTNRAERSEAADPYDTPEYRSAFMDYIMHGTEIPGELRAAGTTAVTIADGFTQTSGVAPQIPTTMGNEIIQKMEQYGNIWNRVRKISVKGGLWFRAVDLDVKATWIDEANVSNYQKFENNEKISFSFFMLECRIAQSILMNAVTFDDFRAMFVPAIAKAMVKALEAAIMKGNGTDQPLGILNDPRVASKGTVIEVTKEQFASWQKWHSDIWAKIPVAYRNGDWTMAQSTWDAYIATMADDNHSPVSIGYNPVTGDEVKRIIGKQVDCVESYILPDFDSAKAGDVVAIFGDWQNYLVNTQPGLPMTTKRWVDEETNTEKTKCLVAVDGKVLDPYGWVLVKKKASA